MTQWSKPTPDGALAAAIAGALDADRLQELVEDQVGKAVERWVNDALTGYNNPIRKAFEERLAEVIVPAIERIDLDNARLDVVLTSLVRETAVGDRARLLDKFGKLVCGERREVIAASEILSEYAKYVAQAYDCDGRDVILDDEPSYEPLDCRIELRVHEQRFSTTHQDASLCLYVEGCDGGARGGRMPRPAPL